MVAIEQAATKPQSRHLRWLDGLGEERRLLLGLLLLITCLYSLLARDTYSSDFRAYYVAAQAAHHGLDPYLNQINIDERYADGAWLQVNSRFIYPPSSLLLFAPIAHLPYRAAKVAFASSMALLMVAILLFLSGHFPRARWVALGLFLSLPMASNIDNGQVDILILALALATFYIRRPVVAGLCLGVGIAIKLSPILLILWLCLNRRWRTAAWSLAFSAAFAALSIPIFGAGLWREFFTHLRTHLGPHPAMLIHTYTLFPVLYGRFVVMGTNTYSLHYFFGTRQNPLLALGSAAGASGLAIVTVYLAWTKLTRTGRTLSPETTFAGFLVAALLANPLLWPAGLVACFPLTMLLIERSRNYVRAALLLLTPFFLPIDFIANRRFLLWLLAAACCVFTTRQAARHPSPSATTSVP